MNDPPLTGTEALPQPSRQSDAVTSLIRLGVRSTGKGLGGLVWRVAQ